VISDLPVAAAALSVTFSVGYFKFSLDLLV
jgi:hypothetical protein